MDPEKIIQILSHPIPTSLELIRKPLPNFFIKATTLFIWLLISSLPAYSKQPQKNLSGIKPLFWFKADAIPAQQNGNRVSIWQDQSINQHHTHCHNPQQMPTYQHHQFGGEKPHLIFDGKSNRFDLGNHKDINTKRFYKEKTIIIVFKTSYQIERQQVIYEEGGEHRGLNLSIHQGKLYIGGYNILKDDYHTTPWGYLYLSIPLELNTLYIGVLSYNFKQKAFEGYLNGKYLGKIPEVGILYAHPGRIGIGGACETTILYNDEFLFPEKGGMFFDGNLYEILYYDHAMNQSQSLLVQTYLATKYGIELYREINPIEPNDTQ